MRLHAAIYWTLFNWTKYDLTLSHNHLLTKTNNRFQLFAHICASTFNFFCHMVMTSSWHFLNKENSIANKIINLIYTNSIEMLKLTTYEDWGIFGSKWTKIIKTEWNKNEGIVITAAILKKYTLLLLLLLSLLLFLFSAIFMESNVWTLD